MSAPPAGRSAPTTTKNVISVVEEVTSRLGSRTEARWIVEHAVRNCDPTAGAEPSPSRVVSPAARESIRGMVNRRLDGEPLQYVLGSWAFRGLEVLVDPRVLIPRPETEQVVEFALEVLREIERGLDAEHALLVADLGTGSGAIALSIASEASVGKDRRLDVWATDRSAEALEVAASNQRLLAGRDAPAASRVRCSEGWWFEALPVELRGRFHLIVSNPPYVSASEWARLEPVIRDHEPVAALVSGERGDEVLEHLLLDVGSWLAPGGAVVLELAPDQADAVADRAQTVGLVGVEVRPDLAGRPRALVARRRDGRSGRASPQGL